MHRWRRWLISLFLFSGCLSPSATLGQVDPIPRELIQLGYNASFQGHPPIAAYAFYLRNTPNFIHTNLTLRLAIAPTYLDSELGVLNALGAHTDLGIGMAGGGFADSYDEIRGGTLRINESFVGHGGEGSLSVYHCFNPDDLIPLNGVLRGIAHYSDYERDDGTSKNFQLPADHATFSVRTGLRWGGKEPMLYPSLAMELSVWYEGQFRTAPGPYGFTNSSGGLDRKLERISHLFWGQALLAYTFTNTGQNFYISLMGGTSVNADRFSAYRLGALLPLVAEFPLSLPGYYYQELSAKSFVLLGGNYTIPIDRKDHWNVNFMATTAGVDYIPGFRQPGAWHSGVGGGILYKARALKCMIGYAYGIDAIRSSGRGAHSVGILLQVDLGKSKEEVLNPYQPGRWRGFQRIFGSFVD